MSPDPPGFYRQRGDGIDLFVRLTPKSAADRIEKTETSADGRAYLVARVRAAPEKGEANAALERLIASAVDVPRSTVEIVSGHTSRLKTVRISAAPPPVIETVTVLEGAPSGEPTS